MWVTEIDSFDWKKKKKYYIRRVIVAFNEYLIYSNGY